MGPRSVIAAGGALALLYIGIIISLFGAWLTHVIVTIQAQEWIFLLAGAIFAPIGIVHGFGVWFGVW